ncbi:MAG: methylenetetrahydrofolate reductase [Alphaproteobacteria bacterium]|nr:methylenetetrahydrofolate reductase [Alphaproteobacteria bacterium]
MFKTFTTPAKDDATNGTMPARRPRLAASIEISPAHVAKRPELLRHIPPATRAYIVDLGANSPSEWASICQRVVAAGLEPVPHIAARRFTSRKHLDARLAAVVREAGVRDVLLIAGEATPPAGPYRSSMDVLESGLLERHGIRRIAVAGHPEGHPAMSSQAAADALHWKQAYAARTEADMRIVTQFGFRPDQALAWAARLATAGIRLPVHLGIAGPASVGSLLKYAAMCGVMASGRFLARNGAAVTSLMTQHSPEQYVAPVEEHVAAQSACLIKQFHVFPFGGIARAAEWLEARGSWDRDARQVFEQYGTVPDLGRKGIAPQKFG